MCCRGCCIRNYYFKELEEIEEKWKQETLKLIGMVNKLKDENKRLNDAFNENNLNSVQNDQLSNLKLCKKGFS